jgi:hypothetical protein
MTGVIELSSAVPLPAGRATPAAAATTTAAASATAAAAAFASSATTAAAKAAPLGPRPCFVDDQVASAQVGAIERADGLFGLAGVCHLDKRKPSRAARVTVGYQMN